MPQGKVLRYLLFRGEEKFSVLAPCADRQIGEQTKCIAALHGAVRMFVRSGVSLAVRRLGMGDLVGARIALHRVSSRARDSRDISTQMSFTNDSYISLVGVACTIASGMVEGLAGRRVRQLELVQEAVGQLDALAESRENGELLVAISGMRRVAEAVRQRWS